MGISISGFVSNDDNLDEKDLENLLKVSLIFKENSTWESLKFCKLVFDEIFIIKEQEWTIVYYSDLILEYRHDNIKAVLTKAKEGLHFGLDDTSMT